MFHSCKISIPTSALRGPSAIAGLLIKMVASFKQKMTSKVLKSIFDFVLGSPADYFVC